MMMVHILSTTEAELIQLDRTRHTALLHRSTRPEDRPRPISRRLSAIARRAWALAF